VTYHSHSTLPRPASRLPERTALAFATIFGALLVLLVVAHVYGEGLDLSITATHRTTGVVAGVNVLIIQGKGEACGVATGAVSAVLLLETQQGVQEITCARPVVCECVNAVPKTVVTVAGPLVGGERQFGSFE